MTTPDAILLPYQRRWMKDKSQVRLWEKSRQIGASWCAACEAVLGSAVASGEDSWYIGYNQEMAQEFISNAAMWAKSLSLAASEVQESIIADERQDILIYEIKLASGHRVKALSSRPTSLRGKGGYVIIDEAAHHDDLPGLIKAAMAFLIWGGRVSILSTHNGVDSEFDRLITETKKGRQDISLHKTTFQQAVEQGLYHRICQRRKVDWTAKGEAEWVEFIYNLYSEGADEELDCIPAKSGGAYLPVGLIEECMYPAPVLRYEVETEFTWKPEAYRVAECDAWCREKLLPLIVKLPQQHMHAFGEDFGRTADITVLAPVTIEQNLVRRVPFLVELRRMPFQQQQQIVFYLLSKIERFAKGCFDATGNGQQLAEASAQKFGLSRIEQVHLTDKLYGEMLPLFRGSLEDRTFLVPSDSDVRDDLRAFQIINGTPRLPKARTSKAHTPQRHGDAAIALVLGHYASMLDYRALEYQAAGQQKRHNNDGAQRPVQATAGFRSRKGIW